MRHGHHTIAVATDIAVELLPGTVAAAEGLEPAIAAAWAAAQARAGGRLFNGRVFSVAELSASRITGRLVEYRLAVAAYSDPALASALGVRPLSVCGVLRMPDGILFGRRQTGATYEAGLWQMPPAGSVDAGALRGGQVDVAGQIRTELAEEIGLGWSRISTCRAFAVVVHAASGVHDLGFLLETDAEFAEVTACRRQPAAANMPNCAWCRRRRWAVSSPRRPDGWCRPRPCSCGRWGYPSTSAAGR